VLAELVDGAREDCAARKRLRPGLTAEVTAAPPPRRRSFLGALTDAARPGFPLICEVKRASPSVGELRAEADAPETARAYVSAGARCVSVLTEPRRFKGSLEDLRAVRARVDVPLLRKDFIVDPYMVYEAKEAGADCVLLIVAAVDPQLLVELDACARELGLAVLVELIFERDLDALGLLPSVPLVGVNARDLETLQMDAERFGRLAARAQAPGRVLVAESGIQSAEDIRRVRGQGAAAALVGESLMRAADPAAAVRALVEA
jgi:indole-3-glycerol phosphate synthase